MGETDVEGEENEKIWMIRLDFRKSFPSYQMMEAMSKKKSKVKPSL